MGKTITALRVDRIGGLVSMRFLAQNPRGVRYTLASAQFSTSGKTREECKTERANVIGKHLPEKSRP